METVMIPVRKMRADLLEERRRIDKAIAALERNLRGRPKLVRAACPKSLNSSAAPGR